MAVLTERLPVDRITEQARQVKFWRSVLTALAGLLFGLGWLAAKTFALLWLAGVWSVTAVKLGWQEARRGPARAG
ncbi:hypothetical protein ACIRJO_02875 [Streptomyces sp. NPDC102394]|uniref:hypothetical protein n=1 Tax=Streptomyces sp. NPDC102394 TaxID=3366167 RepID=UPI00382EFCA3